MRRGILLSERSDFHEIASRCHIFTTLAISCFYLWEIKLGAPPHGIIRDQSKRVSFSRIKVGDIARYHCNVFVRKLLSDQAGICSDFIFDSSFK